MKMSDERLVEEVQDPTSETAISTCPRRRANCRRSTRTKLGGVDYALGEEPATMSEVGTKLDLARAYMDMGDPEGARSILDEVLQEGNASQKQEAQRLIASLP